MYARTLSKPWLLVPLALGTVALTAACGPYGGASSAAATGAMSGSGPVVASAATSLGTIIVDSGGRTIYDFDQDTGTTSTCDGECAVDWPPVAAPAHLPASLPGVSGRLGSTNRDDGIRQLTIAGHPVYTYAGDGAPGQTNGQGLQLNGGLWSVVSTAGSPVPVGATPASSSY